MIATDGMEDTLGQLLNDPGAMAQILSLAQSLGLQPPAAPAGNEPQVAAPSPPAAPPQKPPAAPAGNEPRAAAPAPSAPSGMPDLQMMQSMMRLLQQSQHTDGKQEALFCALKPYLSTEKREKLDRALQMAKLSRLAGFAMKNYGTVAKKGDK